MTQDIDMILRRIGMLRSRLQGDDRRPDRDPGGLRGQQLVAIRLRLLREIAALEALITKIQADPTLSPEGQRQAVVEVAKKMDLAFLTAMQGETSTEVSRYQALLLTTPKSEHSETLAFLREESIRRKLEGQPTHVILMSYQTAVLENNYERQRALTQGPDGSLVPAEFQQRALLDHAKKSQPGIYENFQQATTLKEHLDSLSEQASSVLQTMADATSARAVA